MITKSSILGLKKKMASIKAKAEDKFKSTIFIGKDEDGKFCVRISFRNTFDGTDVLTFRITMIIHYPV